MKKISELNVKTKKIILIILISIMVVLQFSFLSYLIKGLMPKDDSLENILMTYKSNGNIDYKVYYKKNELLNTEELDQDNAYILGLIDYISVNSFYNYNATESTPIKGNTKLTAKLKINYRESSDKNSNPEVMEKVKVLKTESFEFDQKTYSNVQSSKIYLGEYIDVLNKFQQEMRLSVEGYLEIYSDTSFSGKISGVDFNENNYSMVLKIPLSKSVFTLDNVKGKEKEDKVYLNDIVKKNTSVKFYLIIVNVIVFAGLLVLIKLLLQLTKKDEYKQEITKLLTNYDDIIVNVDTLISLEGYEFIEIKEFKELLNLSRELLLPIMYFEIEKDKESLFYVMKGNMIYKYTVIKKETAVMNKDTKLKKQIKKD